MKGKLQRLRQVTTEAQEVGRDLQSQVQRYEQELLRISLPKHRTPRPHPPAAIINSVPHRLIRRVVRLEVIASEVKALVKGLVEALREIEAQPPIAIPAPPHVEEDLKTQMEDYERELVSSALKSCGMNQLMAARLLGVLPTTLNEKMKRLGLRGGARRRRRGRDQGRGTTPSYPLPDHVDPDPAG